MPMTIPFVQLYIYYGVKDVLPNVIICLARQKPTLVLLSHQLNTYIPAKRKLKRENFASFISKHNAKIIIRAENLKGKKVTTKVSFQSNFFLFFISQIKQETDIQDEIQEFQPQY